MLLRPGVAGAVLAVSLGPTQAFAQDTRPILDSYRISDTRPVQHLLADPLREISGLAVTPDGRLFSHDDERAFIYQLNPQTGEIIKAFRAGWLGASGDFEGIAVAGERFFLVTSEGSITEFREGEAGARVGYEVFPTGLGRACEVEGLAFDEGSNSLLLACKTARSQALVGHFAVFAFSLDTMSLEESPVIRIPESEIDAAGGRDEFRASGLEIHPFTGALIVISAQDETIIEISREGHVLSAERLSDDAHAQTEGITFAADGTMLLADEAAGGRARLSLYSFDGAER